MYPTVLYAEQRSPFRFSIVVRAAEDFDPSSWIIEVDGGEAELVELRRTGSILTFELQAVQESTAEESLVRIRAREDKSYICGGFVSSPTKLSKRKLFFLHIPKTAGSSCNEYFVAHFGRSQTHIEAHRASDYSGIEVDRLEFMSGHVRTFELMKYLDLGGFVRATLLREPLEQLLSHVKWVLYLCEDKSSDRYKRQPDQVKDLGGRLSEIDFFDAQSIERGFDALPQFGHLLFNNCQTRYLLNAPDPVYMEPDHGFDAIDGLGFFDAVGVTSNIDGFIERIGQCLGVSFSAAFPVVNASRNAATFAVSDATARALAPFYRVDQMVFDAIAARNAAR